MQKLKTLQKSLENYTGEIPFPLVADPELEVFRKYRAFDDFEDQPLHGTFLIDAQGRITSASTAATSSTLTIAADSGSNDTVTVGTDTLTFEGTANEVDTTVSNNKITITVTTRRCKIDEEAKDCSHYD